MSIHSTLNTPPLSDTPQKRAILNPGADAIKDKGWLGAHKWLLLRRLSQLSILTLFLMGPWFGLWLVKGNLSASLTLGVLPLTDIYMLLQSIAAGHWPYKDALLGAAIVAAFYMLVGGRSFCSWVCPVNIITDSAAWLRRKLGIKQGKKPHPNTRHWLLGLSLVAAFATGSMAWEWVNPVSMLQRGLIFGFGLSWGIVGGVFLYDLLIANRGWCGHLCPMGACYSLIGQRSIIRISASKRKDCNDCMDCFAICPEPQVIRPALKATGQTHPLILDANCTNCARCIDVCNQNVFRLTTRFDRSES